MLLIVTGMKLVLNAYLVHNMITISNKNEKVCNQHSAYTYFVV